MSDKTHASEIGAALSAAFARQGLTQTAVAARYGVSQSRIGRIYAGDFGVRSGTAQKMCGDLGVKFLDASADKRRYAHNRRRLIRLLDAVWTGTDKDAAHVANALIALGRLRSQ